MNPSSELRKPSLWSENPFTEMCSISEAGSYLGLIDYEFSDTDFCVTEL